jgi:hypothetical protein
MSRMARTTSVHQFPDTVPGPGNNRDLGTHMKEYHEISLRVHHGYLESSGITGTGAAKHDPAPHALDDVKRVSLNA